MKFSLRTSICSIALLLFSPTGFAASQYDVELIIFSHDGQSFDDDEVWHSRVEANERNARKLNALRTSKRIRAVNTHNRGRLGNVRDSLVQNPNYTVLSHVVWRQSSLPFGSAPLMDLSTHTSAGTLEGFARVYASQLLFVDVFLHFSQGGSPGNINSLNINSLNSGGQFYIEQKRRLKLKETHYLDHPKFGVIVSVWPAG